MTSIFGQLTHDTPPIDFEEEGCVGCACRRDIMEESSFLEVSLDSVLRKATELVDSLRECKARAASPLTPPPLTPGLTGGRAPLPSNHPPPLICTSPALPASPLQSAATAATANDTAEQWQRLTAYIVSLEKEVQYYKQLSQDVQARQAQGNQTGPSSADVLAYHPRGDGDGRGSEEEQMSSDYWKGVLESDTESHVLLLIFTHLSMRELSQASLVCRKWYIMSRNPLLWKKLIMVEAVVEPQVDS